MKITCIIVEDEPLAMQRAKNYIEKLPFLQLVNSFDNGIDALVYLKSNTVDLIFLDINIGELSGIQLLETHAVKSHVIITTAYHQHAIKGFELDVTDYLLKPYTFERFVQAVDRVKNDLEKTDATSGKNFIFIKTEYRLEKIFFDEILYIEGMRDYRCIYLTNRRIMTLQTFKELEQEIPKHILFRVHKSYMVAIDKIETIEKDEIRIKHVTIPISGTYKSDFFALIGK